MFSVLLISVGVVAGLLAALAAGLVVAERVLVSYGPCTIEINAGEEILDVVGGQTLLETLYENEIYIPSACGGKGTCGHCKITVLSGADAVLPTETPFLTRREIRRGLRLACQIKVRNDMSLEIPQEMLSVRLYTATVVSTENLTGDIKEIRLSLDEPAEIPHRPGQYVQVRAPSPEGAVWRAYSISSPAHRTDVIDLVVRLVPGGVGSTYLHNLDVGDKVTFTGPYGDFRLSEDPDVEVVCVAGGCGMAPIRNIIYSIYNRWPGRSCWLFFGCRTTADVFYLEQFQRLASEHPNFHVVYALSHNLSPEEQWDGERGFIHLSVDKYLRAGARRQAFLCGPPEMIRAVTRVLVDKGVDERDIYYDDFG